MCAHQNHDDKNVVTRFEHASCAHELGQITGATMKARNHGLVKLSGPKSLLFMTKSDKKRVKNDDILGLFNL